MGTQFKVLRETLIRFGANERDARSLSVTVSYVNTFADGIVTEGYRRHHQMPEM